MTIGVQSEQRPLKVAFVHDWLVSYRGGERVLEALLPLYPDAPIYTMFYQPKSMPDAISRRRVVYPKWTDWLRPLRKLLLPWYPAIIESFDLFDYDLVISTSSCVAKGVVIGPSSKHVSYIHSPMRYLWDQRQHYYRELAHIPLARFFIELASPRLRTWDVSSNNGIDVMIANSQFVRQRIKRYYGRDSIVVHPPVDAPVDGLSSAFPANPTNTPYFIVAGAFVSYKRFDLAIAVCENLGLTLVIAGSGPLESKLRKQAGKNCRFVINPDRGQWLNLLANAQALLYPGTEDFGIVPIEAMSCGTPVIAHRSGGALDYVIEGKTGLFFDEQNEQSLMTVLRSFSASHFNKMDLSRYARSFSVEAFQKKMSDVIQQLLERPT